VVDTVKLVRVVILVMLVLRSVTETLGEAIVGEVTVSVVVVIVIVLTEEEVIVFLIDLVRAAIVKVVWAEVVVEVEAEVWVTVVVWAEDVGVDSVVVVGVEQQTTHQQQEQEPQEEAVGKNVMLVISRCFKSGQRMKSK
jgi:hypothetical protein